MAAVAHAVALSARHGAAGDAGFCLSYAGACDELALRLGGCVVYVAGIERESHHSLGAEYRQDVIGKSRHCGFDIGLIKTQVEGDVIDADGLQ